MWKIKEFKNPGYSDKVITEFVRLAEINQQLRLFPWDKFVKLVFGK